MRLIRKLVLPVAGVVGAVAIVTIISPRAVHAITAALVQVMNTPTNAVPTTLAPAFTQTYAANCSSNYNGGQYAQCSLPQVPAGQTLFVETVSLYSVSNHGVGPTVAQVASGGSAGFLVPMAQQLSEAGSNLDFYVGTLSARMAIGPQFMPGCYMALSAASTAGRFDCGVMGYLAPAQ